MQIRIPIVRTVARHFRNEEDCVCNITRITIADAFVEFKSNDYNTKYIDISTKTTFEKLLIPFNFHTGNCDISTCYPFSKQVDHITPKTGWNNYYLMFETWKNNDAFDFSEEVPNYESIQLIENNVQFEDIGENECLFGCEFSVKDGKLVYSPKPQITLIIVLIVVPSVVVVAVIVLLISIITFCYCKKRKSF